MKLENNWKQKALQDLEKEIWPPIDSGAISSLVATCHALRKKPIQDFTIEDLRIMIGQKIGLFYLVPAAIDALTSNLFAEGDYYEGDLLQNMVKIDKAFWINNRIYWQRLNDLIKNKRGEISQLNIDTATFDSCKFQLP